MLSHLPQREEFLRKKRKKRIIRYSIFLGIFVFVVAVVSYISYRPSIRISEVELVGGILVTEADVKKTTLDYNQGSYFWLFPRNSSFWYPKQSLKKKLMDNFKRIETLEMNLKNFKTLVVTITERKPIATWCRDEGSVEQVVTPESSTTPPEIKTIPSQCYFIDQNGTIFAVSPFFSGDAYFKYYGIIKEENPIGLEYMASTTKFTEINQFVDSVKGTSLRPQYVIAKENDEFSMVLAGGGEIYFDTKKPLNIVFDNLETLIATPELFGRTARLDYIDLRYGNKLFYKLKSD